MPTNDPIVHHALRRAVRILHKSVLMGRTISLSSVLRVYRRQAGFECEATIAEHGDHWLTQFYRKQQPFRDATWRVSEPLRSMAEGSG